MSENVPRVSVGLPVFNGEKYLAGAIQSILDQTYTDFELIICDNCSTDRTKEICDHFAARDARIRYYRNPENVGANRNFNYAVELARGKYFKWAPHDDLHHATFLEQTVARLETNPAATLSYTYTKLIDRDGNELVPPTHTDHVMDTDGGVIYVGVDSKERRLTSSRTAERFHGVLFMTHWTHEIFGLIRLDSLRQTPVLEPVYGSDKVLLAELCALGPFEEVPEKLFLNRRHAAQSVSVITTEGRSAWSDPRMKKVQHLTSRWLRMRGYLRAALRARGSLSETLGCLRVLFAYYLRVPRWSMMLDDVLGLRLRRLQKEIQEINAELVLLFVILSLVN